MQFLVNRVCVDVTSSVGASPSSVVEHGLCVTDAGHLVAQERPLS